jgi:hypothetical protein
MPQLDWHSVGNLFTELKLYPFLVVDMLLLDPFLKHLEFVLECHTLYRGRWISYLCRGASGLCRCVILHVTHLSGVHGLFFTPVLSHWVIAEFGHHLENHVSVVGHLR